MWSCTCIATVCPDNYINRWITFDCFKFIKVEIRKKVCQNLYHLLTIALNVILRIRIQWKPS